MSEIQAMSKIVDLVHSPDDGGWYFHNYVAARVSVTYPNEADAHAAWDNNAIEWEDEDKIDKSLPATMPWGLAHYAE